MHSKRGNGSLPQAFYIAKGLRLTVGLLCRSAPAGFYARKVGVNQANSLSFLCNETYGTSDTLNSATV